MAELAFKARAEYDEIIKMREELRRLHDEINKVDVSTIDGQKKMQSLTAEYARVNGQMNSLANSAAEYAIKLKQTSDNASRLEDAFKFGRTFEGNRKAVKDFLKDLQSDLNLVRQQIRDAEKGIAEDDTIRAGLEKQLKDAEATLDDTNDVLAKYNFAENVAIGHVLDPLAKSIQDKERQIEWLKKELEELSSTDKVGLAQAAISAKSQYDNLKGDLSGEAGARREQLYGIYSSAINRLNANTGDDEGTMKNLQEIASGNFESIIRYAEELQSAISSAESELSKLDKEYNEAVADIESAGGNDTVLDNMRQQAKDAEENVASLKQQLADLNSGISGSGQTEQDLEDKKQKLGELEAKIKGVQSRLKDDSLSRQNTFQGLAQGIQALMGAYTAASGVLAQFGVDQEDLQKVQTKLQASMSILIGLQHTFNALQAESAFRTKIVDKAMVGLAKAYQKVAASSTLAKLGVAGLVVGIIAATAATVIALSKSAKANRELNEHIKKTSESAGEQLAAFMQLSTQWRAANGNLEKQNQLLNSSKMGKFANDIKTVSDAQKAFVSNSGAYIRALIEQTEAEIYFEQAREKGREGVKAMMEADKFREKYENAGNGLTRTYYFNRMQSSREKANDILAGPDSEMGKLLQKAADASGKAYGGGVSNPEEDEQKARFYKYKEVLKKQAKDRIRTIEDMEFDTRQRNINLMKDTAARELAQLQLDYDKEKKQRERQREDRIQQLQDEQKSRWLIANPNRKDYEFASDIKDLPKAEKELYDKQNSIAEEQFNRSKQDLLDVYGTIDDRRKTLVDRWEETLKGVTDEQVRKILETERDIEFANFDYDNVVDSGKVEEIMEKLRAKIEAEAKKLDPALREQFLAQGYLQIAEMDYDNKSKYGTRDERIQSYQNKLIAESKTIKDPLQRERFLAQGGVKLAEERYGSWRDYNDYEQSVEAAEKVYEAKKIELELRNDNLGLMRLEKEYTQEIWDIEIKYNKDLSKVFGDVSKYTKQQLKDAKTLAQAILNSGELNGKVLTLEQIKDLQEAISKINEAEMNLPYRTGDDNIFNRIRNHGILVAKQKEYNDLTDKTTDAAKNLNAKIEQMKAQEKLDNAAVSAKTFIEALQGAANILSNMGDASLDEAGETLSRIGQNLNAAYQGFQASGSWIGAVVAGVGDLLKQGIEIYSEKVKESNEHWHATLGVLKEIQDIRFENMLDLSNVFGDDSIGRIKAAAQIINEITDGNKRLEGFARQIGMTVEQAEAYGFKASHFTLSNLYGNRYIEYGKRDKRRIQINKYAERLGLNPDTLFDEENLSETITLLKGIKNNYKDLSEESALWIDEAVADLEKYKESIDILKDSLSNLFGNTASQLADATIEGLRTGATVGTDQMKRILSGGVQDMRKMLVQSLYADYLKQYEPQMLKALQKGDVEGLVEIYAEAIEGLQGTMAVANQAAERINEIAEAKGFNMNELQNADSGAKAYQTISENTASSVDGRLASLQIAQGERAQQMGLITANFDELNRIVSHGVDLASDILRMQADTLLSVNQIRDSVTDGGKNTLFAEIKEIRNTVNDIRRTL